MSKGSVTTTLINLPENQLKEQAAIANLPTQTVQVTEGEASVSPQQPNLFEQLGEDYATEKESGVLPESLEDSSKSEILESVAAMTEQMAGEKFLEQSIEEQAQFSMQPDIRTRKEEGEPFEYDYLGQYDNSVAGDGGLSSRANALSLAIDKKDFKLGKLDQQRSNLRPVLEKLGAYDASTALPTREFTYVMALVVEDALVDMSNAADRTAPVDTGTDTDVFEVETPTEPMEIAFTKAQGNKKLGDRINREFKKLARRESPDLQIDRLSNEDSILLGDFAKEAFAAFHGPSMVTRSDNRDGQTEFAFTKAGMDILSQSERERKRLFPKTIIRTHKSPPARGRLEGDLAEEIRNVSTKGGPVVGQGVIRKGMDNASKVANPIDKDRLKIVYMTALPVLMDPIGTMNSVKAEINHLGSPKMKKFNAKVKSDKRKGRKDTIVPEKEYLKLVNNLAQDLFGIALERHGANYFTYYMQGFNGRIAPQQSTLDPTTSKTARFVTRNAVPSIASDIDGNGRRIHRNLRQMYANALVKDADVLLPEAREVALDKAMPQLVEWGRKLKSIMDTVPDDLVESVSVAIENRIPINDPRFPKLPPLGLDFSKDRALIDAIKDKGEDGQMFIDGLIDVANYYDALNRAKISGKPFKYASYFNAYMDGKTNGIASNAMQMGSIEVAFRTGVLRTQDKQLLDKNMDIRAQLKELLIKDVDENGFDGNFKNREALAVEIAKKLYSLKDLNKATTMTFGYGKELASFKEDIDDFMSVLEENNQEFADMVDNFTFGGKAKLRNQLVTALHAKYIPKLSDVLDPMAIETRSIMRSVAGMAALMNEMFTIRTHTGYELNLGAGLSTGIEQRIGYRIDGQKRDAAIFGTEFTSAAEKVYIKQDKKGKPVKEVVPGGVAYGGSVPAPVQSLDAATVAMTLTGKSWDRLTQASGGNPYVHTIYDAFKVDAMGYDVVLEEVNNNWLEASLNWSYLKEARRSLREMRDNFKKRKGIPMSLNELRMADYFKGDPDLIARHVNKYRDIRIQADDHRVMELAELFYKIQDRDDYIEVVDKFYKLIDIEDRLDEMISKTEANKQKLRKKIKDMGVATYQYYSH